MTPEVVPRLSQSWVFLTPDWEVHSGARSQVKKWQGGNFEFLVFFFEFPVSLFGGTV
jgi:hypothetical protein